MLGCGIFSSHNWESLKNLITSLEATGEECSFYLFPNIRHHLEGSNFELEDAGMELDAVINVFLNSNLPSKRVILHIPDELEAIDLVLGAHQVGVFLRDNVVVPQTYFSQIREKLSTGGIVSLKLASARDINWAVRKKDWQEISKLRRIKLYA